MNMRAVESPSTEVIEAVTDAMGAAFDRTPDATYLGSQCLIAIFRTACEVAPLSHEELLREAARLDNQALPTQDTAGRNERLFMGSLVAKYADRASAQNEATARASLREDVSQRLLRLRLIAETAMDYNALRRSALFMSSVSLIPSISREAHSLLEASRDHAALSAPADSADSVG